MGDDLIYVDLRKDWGCTKGSSGAKEEGVTIK